MSRIIITPEKISEMREMRLSGKGRLDTALACKVSPYTIDKYCGDIKVDNRKKRFQVEPPRADKLQSKVNSFKISELSLEDQKKYSECRPTSREYVGHDFV